MPLIRTYLSIASSEWALKTRPVDALRDCDDHSVFDLGFCCYSHSCEINSSRHGKLGNHINKMSEKSFKHLRMGKNEYIIEIDVEKSTKKSMSFNFFSNSLGMTERVNEA